jgi:hypothetical protein
VLISAAPGVLEALMLRHVGLRIGHLEYVVLVDEKAARTAELFPLAKKRAVRAEDIDTIVGSVGDEDPACRIDRQRMIDPELAGAGTPPAPRRDELASLVNLTIRALVLPPCPSLTMISPCALSLSYRHSSGRQSLPACRKPTLLSALM